MALCRLLRKPFVIKLHGSDVNVHAAHPLHAAQARWAARQASAVICVSEAIRQRALALGVPADKLVVIHNGVDADRFFPMPRAAARVAVGVAEQRKLILFVGNVLATKGVRELFTAFRNLSNARPELDLVVVGDGPELAWLEDQTKASGLGPRVRLVGRLPHDALGVWFNAADLVCLPSYNEGLPNVLLEAMACGVPCVATRVGGIPEAIDATSGELVEPRDANGLALALARALDRTWDRDAIVQRAAGFSWGQNLEAMSRLLDGVIRSR
jgi:glycosyltransferase involved in cell wall biosynthesis